MFYLSDKGVVFGAPLTEEGIAQIYQLIEYLSKSEYHLIAYLQPSGQTDRQICTRDDICRDKRSSFLISYCLDTPG